MKISPYRQLGLRCYEIKELPESLPLAPCDTGEKDCLEEGFRAKPKAKLSSFFVCVSQGPILHSWFPLLLPSSLNSGSTSIGYALHNICCTFQKQLPLKHISVATTAITWPSGLGKEKPKKKPVIC